MKTHYVLFATLILAGCAATAPSTDEDVDIGVLWAEHSAEYQAVSAQVYAQARRDLPRLLAEGLKGMIGKGSRSEEVRESMQQHKAVYLAVVGGVAANSRLRERIRADAPEHLRICLPPLDLCTDNAAMIAAAGQSAYAKATADPPKLGCYHVAKAGLTAELC